MSQHSSLAVLADIHGNALALEAVIDDARLRGLTEFINLGDTFFGPLDPAETWKILKKFKMITILGNQDRILLEGGKKWDNNSSFKATMEALGSDGMAWIASLPPTTILDNDVFLCHGTPRSDLAYLLEDISTGLPAMRSNVDISEDIFPEANECSLVLAGHSHHPGLVNCKDVTVVNPGSVGLPAYDDDTPPHIMASGSPHAKYAVLTPTEAGWETDFVSVEYDWQAASDMARRNGRDDWAQWLLTGMA